MPLFYNAERARSPQQSARTVDEPNQIQLKFELFLFSPCNIQLHGAEICSKLQQGVLMAVIADEGVVRVTTTISREKEQTLKQLAARHKVSVAWLVRYAVDQLVEQGRDAQLPLDFGRRV